MKPDSGQSGVFATTHWSVVLAAAQPDAPGHDAALEQLCQTYWYPVYGFIRRRGSPPADAEDLTQEFFARLLAKEWLASVEENGNRFRSFLLTMVSRFLANQYDRSTAAKRGGGVRLLQLEQAENRFQAEAPDRESAERHFDRHWALAVMDAALQRLREEVETSPRHAAFEALSAFLSREPAPGEYDAVAVRLNMNTGAVAVAVHRLRRRYRELVRTLIAATVTHPSEVETELQYLIDVLET